MIIGHEKQIKFLKIAFSKKILPHFLLFSGPEKIGKKQVAIEFASWVLDENPKNHPDFFLIEPENKIQINEIREISYKFSLTPLKAKHIICIIDEAHLMTEQAQQAFLKTLEEPKTQSIFILITSYPYRLLPTILSRCQKINFYRLKNEEMLTFLEDKKNITDKEKEFLLGVSAGRPGVLLNLISKENRKKIIKKLSEIPSFSLVERFRFVKEISEVKDIKEILKTWLDFFHYVFLKRIKEKKEVHVFYSLEKIKVLLEETHKMFFLISNTNINPRSALEILMLQF